VARGDDLALPERESEHVQFGRDGAVHLVRDPQGSSRDGDEQRGVAHGLGEIREARQCGAELGGSRVALGQHLQQQRDAVRARNDGVELGVGQARAVASCEGERVVRVQRVELDDREPGLDERGHRAVV